MECNWKNRIWSDDPFISKNVTECDQIKNTQHLFSRGNINPITINFHDVNLIGNFRYNNLLFILKIISEKSHISDNILIIFNSFKIKGRTVNFIITFILSFYYRNICLFFIIFQCNLYLIFNYILINTNTTFQNMLNNSALLDNYLLLMIVFLFE